MGEWSKCQIILLGAFRRLLISNKCRHSQKQFHNYQAKCSHHLAEAVIFNPLTYLLTYSLPPHPSTTPCVRCCDQTPWRQFLAPRSLVVTRCPQVSAHKMCTVVAYREHRSSVTCSCAHAIGLQSKIDVHAATVSSPSHKPNDVATRLTAFDQVQHQLPARPIHYKSTVVRLSVILRNIIIIIFSIVVVVINSVDVDVHDENSIAGV